MKERSSLVFASRILKGSFTLVTSVVLVVSFLHFAKAASAGVTLVTDGDFSPTNWTATIAAWLDAPAGSNPTFSAQQQTTGGNPGFYRHITHTWGTGRIWVAHKYLPFVYDPSRDGAIRSIQFSWDLVWFLPSDQPNGVGYALMVLQDNNVYVARYHQIVFSAHPADNWISFSFTNVTASDFQRLDPVVGRTNGAPNFSATGDPIEFGFVSQNGTEGSHVLTTESGIDNFRVEIEIGPPRVVIRVSEVEISWQSRTNDSYTVLYSSDLAPNLWDVLEVVTCDGTTNRLECLQGDGSVMRVYDRIPVGENQKFYNLVVTNCVPGL